MQNVNCNILVGKDAKRRYSTVVTIVPIAVAPNNCHMISRFYSSPYKQKSTMHLSNSLGNYLFCDDFFLIANLLGNRILILKRSLSKPIQETVVVLHSRDILS